MCRESATQTLESLLSEANGTLSQRGSSCTQINKCTRQGCQREWNRVCFLLSLTCPAAELMTERMKQSVLLAQPDLSHSGADDRVQRQRAQNISLLHRYCWTWTLWQSRRPLSIMEYKGLCHVMYLLTQSEQRRFSGWMSGSITKWTSLHALRECCPTGSILSPQQIYQPFVFTLLLVDRLPFSSEIFITSGRFVLPQPVMQFKSPSCSFGHFWANTILIFYLINNFHVCFYSKSSDAICFCSRSLDIIYHAE